MRCASGKSTLRTFGLFDFALLFEFSNFGLGLLIVNRPSQAVLSPMRW